MFLLSHVFLVFPVLCWFRARVISGQALFGEATLLLPSSAPRCPWNSRRPKEVRGLAGHPVLD